MATVADEMYTAGDFVRLTGRTQHQIDYCIRSRGIQPLRTLGGRHIYGAEALEQLKNVLAEIDGRKAGNR